jgi:uncharacterized protein (DUF58 family)
MSIIDRINDWLETHWVTPAYAGCLLGGIALSFFGAATNTMAGWLYAISGLILALLVLAAILPARSLQSIQVRRRPIAPVSVGDKLAIDLEIENHSSKPKTLLQIQDVLQSTLGSPVQTAVDAIAPQSIHHWFYNHPATKRGVYRWHEVQLRTATPLGLFWCRRSWDAPAKAIIYPTVLPLTYCPLIDEIGREDSAQFYSDRRSHAATEDLTRGLRPYRVGDPIRLIHWRTSARYGDLQVRELEVFTGSQEIIICLDSSTIWHPDDFEQAVIAAASMYCYAAQRKLQVKLWTPRTGTVQGNRVVLEVLAETNAGEDALVNAPSNLPLIWLTQNPASLDTLPIGSRWALWPSASLNAESAIAAQPSHLGIVIAPTQPLQHQLQQPLR